MTELSRFFPDGGGDGAERRVGADGVQVGARQLHVGRHQRQNVCECGSLRHSMLHNDGLGEAKIL